jgi:hypothetical protein
MAKQVIGIGTTANDGTGDQVRVAFDKVNDNFTELYDSQPTDSDDISEGSTNKYLLDDSVTHNKLGSEFTTSTALTGTFNPVIFAYDVDIDFSLSQVYTYTLQDTTIFSISNAEIGMVKDVILTGDYTLQFPSGSTVAGTYDGTVSNLVQIIVTGSGQYWYSISQPQ